MKYCGKRAEMAAAGSTETEEKTGGSFSDYRIFVTNYRIFVTNYRILVTNYRIFVTGGLLKAFKNKGLQPFRNLEREEDSERI